MKLFLKIAGGILGVVILLIIGLNIYLTDERIKNIILPHLSEALGREVEVESASFTFFRTFPSFGLAVTNVRIPDTDPPRDARGTVRQREGGVLPTLASLDGMIMSVELIPLLSGNLNVTRMDLDRLMFKYVIYEDGTTNTDSLIEYMQSGEPESETESSAEINLASVRVWNASLGFEDHASETSVYLSGLNMEMALFYDELIETDIQSEVEKFQLTIGGDKIIDGLPLSLVQKSTIDLENEQYVITTGTLNIRGLDLDAEGSVSGWSGEAVMLDLFLNSSSDDFAALLEMVPDAYKEELKDVVTSGTIVVQAHITGYAGEGHIPDFNAIIGVDNGFMQYPGVDKPIEDIQIRLEAHNDLITIERFEARADVNFVNATGRINNPLEDDADFNLDAELDMDLSTVKNFYPLNGMELDGILKMTANAIGELAKTEDARFNADLNLANGFVKLPEREEPVRNMNIRMTATQDRADISSFSAEAAGNILDFNGTIDYPLDEERTRFNLRGKMDLDLATIPKFYPIDTDTLEMRGKLNFDGTATGRLADVENTSLNGRLDLANGFVRYHEFPKPIEEFSFKARMEGEKISISESAVKTGGNDFSASGEINRYMSDSPTIAMRIIGDFILDEIHEFMDLGPYVSTISGRAQSNIRISGPVMESENLIFNGSLQVYDFNLESDSLRHPVRDLNGDLLFSNEDLNLRNLTMRMGESDFNLTGELKHYKRLINNNPSDLAELNATFTSQRLNVDELYEYVPLPEDAEPVQYPVELPNIKTRLSVDVAEMTFFDVDVTNLKGMVESDNQKVIISDAVAEFFGGSANGNVRWDVPQPDRTKLTFAGGLDNVQVNELFRKFNPAGLGEAHEYFSGSFSTMIEYVTELDVYLDPIPETTVADGNFGMVRARMQNHPTQIRAADLLRTAQLRDLALDNLLSKIDITDSVMTLNDFNITSTDIGVVLNGTQHLINNSINYRVTVVLPGSVASNLEPVLTKDGIEALKRSDGKVEIPFKITGTTEQPTAGLDAERIQARITDYLRDRGTDELRDRLRNLFN